MIAIKIDGYDNYLACSNGIILSTKTGKAKPLKPLDNGNGYLAVSLSKNGKVRRFYIHRLIAESFLENIEKKEEVNHIDGNRGNNSLSNLEWVTRSENHHHRYKVLGQRGVNYGKTGAKNWKSKPVLQYDKEMNFVAEYPGVMEAQRQTGISESNIRCVIYGRSKTAGGYKWEYKAQ